jgi:RNA polymerase-binding protein DksA
MISQFMRTCLNRIGKAVGNVVQKKTKKATKKVSKKVVKKAVKKTAKKVVKKAKKTTKKAVGKTTKKTKKATSPAANKKLTKKEIEYFQGLLLEKRRELLRNVFEFEDEALGKSRQESSGDLSCMPVHMADLGTDTYEQEFALGLMDSERRLLQEIDEALGRINEGSYGICMGTGKPIRRARLEAQPWANYCVEYARMLEEGLVKPEQ